MNVLHFGPSATLHEASTGSRMSTRSRAAPFSGPLPTPPPPPRCAEAVLAEVVLADREFAPFSMGVEEGLLHPVFGAGEFFGAHANEPQGAWRLLTHQNFIGSQGFQRQGGDLHARVHGHILWG